MKWLQDPQDPLPPTHLAWPPESAAPGLLAAGGELTPERLQQAYTQGVFPWYSQGQPILWWSPPKRIVLPVSEFKLSRSLRKTISKFHRSPHCELRIDSAFRQVITHCAHTPRAGQDGSWIVQEMLEAYVRLHDLGMAHSVETWIDGHLVGGLYGVCLGRMFFGESMFSHCSNASKIAFAALVSFCEANQVPLIDCQMYTGHLASLGAREIPRHAFELHLARHVHQDNIIDWTYDSALWTRWLPTLSSSGPTSIATKAPSAKP